MEHQRDDVGTKDTFHVVQAGILPPAAVELEEEKDDQADQGKDRSIPGKSAKAHKTARPELIGHIESENQRPEIRSIDGERIKKIMPMRISIQRT